jgi:hypothetical protein
MMFALCAEVGLTRETASNIRWRYLGEPGPANERYAVLVNTQ